MILYQVQFWGCIEEYGHKESPLFKNKEDAEKYLENNKEDMEYYDLTYNKIVNIPVYNSYEEYTQN